MRLSEFVMARVVSGAGPPPPFTANVTPGRLASTNTLCSSMGRLKLAVVEKPLLSVAVATNSRYESSPWSGTTDV